MSTVFFFCTSLFSLTKRVRWQMDLMTSQLTSGKRMKKCLERCKKIHSVPLPFLISSSLWPLGTMLTSVLNLKVPSLEGILTSGVICTLQTRWRGPPTRTNISTMMIQPLLLPVSVSLFCYLEIYVVRIMLSYILFFQMLNIKLKGH